MIENNQQLSVTKQRLEEFEGALNYIKNLPYYPAQEIQIAGVKGMIETLNKEIKEYEKTYIES